VHFHTNVRSITPKRMISKCSNLVRGMTLGYPTIDFVLGLKGRRSRLGLRLGLTAIRRGLECLLVCPCSHNIADLTPGRLLSCYTFRQVVHTHVSLSHKNFNLVMAKRVVMLCGWNMEG